MGLKKKIEVLAVVEAFFFSYLLWAAWMHAYINGYQVTIDVNYFGEAVPELLLLFLWTPLSVLGLSYYLEESK